MTKIVIFCEMEIRKQKKEPYRVGVTLWLKIQFDLIFK